MNHEPFSLLDWLRQPWHWSVSGLVIALVMFLLLYAGGRFALSSSFRVLCAVGGAGRRWSFFRFDWREQAWQLFFVFGAILGGWIASTWLASPAPPQISQHTIEALAQLGFASPETTGGSGYLPTSLFSWSVFQHWQGWLALVGGGFLIGFGTRWAGGCTSGHAISGLSNLQWPSLIAVIGFFIGGLLMTHWLFPLIFTNWP